MVSLVEFDVMDEYFYDAFKSIGGDADVIGWRECLALPA
jgi:hypothetical protein